MVINYWNKGAPETRSNRYFKVLYMYFSSNIGWGDRGEKCAGEGWMRGCTFHSSDGGEDYKKNLA